MFWDKFKLVEGFYVEKQFNQFITTYILTSGCKRSWNCKDDMFSLSKSLFCVHFVSWVTLEKINIWDIVTDLCKINKVDIIH